MHTPPRLSVEISEQQLRDLNRLLPWGTRAVVFRALIDDLIRMLKINPSAVVGALISKSITLEDFPTLKDRYHGHAKQPPS